MSSPVITPPVPEQKRFEYQPTDDLGRPMGGVQVILYTTGEELAQKLAHQNTLLIRKLREEGRKRRLGIDDDAVPATAEKATGVTQFQERPLTAEERFKISQMLNDPEHFAEGRDLLLESALGVPPAKLREFFNEGQVTQMRDRAADNFLTFAQAKVSEGYYDCTENREIIADWVFKKGYAPTASNFAIAYQVLQQAGLLVGQPVQQQVPTPSAPVTPETDLALNPEAQPQPQPSQPTRISEPAQTPTTRQSHIPSGLNERTSSTSGVSVTPVSGATRQDGSTLTLKEINRMPSDEIRRRMADPAFVQLVQKLENEDKARKAALGLQKF